MAKQPTKREPTLADRLLNEAWGGGYAELLDPKWIENTKTSLRIAKKFVLDREASRYLARMIKENPRIVADAQDFAIPAFDHMSIELDYETFYEEISGKRPQLISDTKVLYLFDGPLVKVASWSLDSTGVPACTFTPAEFVLHRPMSEADQQAFCDLHQTTALGLDLWFWGSTAKSLIDGAKESFVTLEEGKGKVVVPEGADLHDGWAQAGLRALRDNHTARLVPLELGAPGVLYKTVANSSAGDLRNIVSLLLFLNRTQDIQYVRDFGPGSMFVHRQPRPLAPHHVISLKLDPLPRLRSLCAGVGIKRRLHDVRGHFCHDRRARSGCPHGEEREGDFGERWLEVEHFRWECELCGGKRWWRNPHSRGTLEKGVLTASYAVTK